ncbi:MAG: hypothetical protein O7G85_14440 [Planctomycetota bacterium]|nr:hypothetical protein [Planctomycetota bacterium]
MHTPQMDCEERCRVEVEQLHRFFQDWFKGTMPKTVETFDRFANVLAPSFELLSPIGRILKREGILIALRSGHGGQPHCQIWIENHRHRMTIGDLTLVTYEEWQQVGEERRGRLSSALLQAREDTPNGLQWLHVHETWLPTD